LIYIFEGSDLAGKTTKANLFHKQTKFPIIKKRFDILEDYKDKTILKKDKIELFSHFFFESIYPLGESYDFIMDRALISSLVYSKFFNRKYPVNYIYDFLLSRNQFIQIYYVYADDESIRARYKSRGESFFSVEEIIIIKGLYNKIIKKLEEENVKIIKIENNNS